MRLLTAITLTLIIIVSAGAASGPALARQQPPVQAAEDLNALNQRARGLYDAKKYEEAEKVARTAVEAAERQFGPNSAEASAELMNLANILAARRDSQKARKALARVIELRVQRHGPSQTFEQDALELFTCLDASDLKGKPDLDMAKVINRILAEDSVLEQGLKLSPDASELQVGEIMSKPPPQYPVEAKMTHASGAVIIKIIIDEAGRIVGMRPLDCSTKVFRAVSLSAAQRATFGPTLVNGKPVKVRGLIFYRYILM